MKKSEIISICTESCLQHNNSQREHRYTRGWDSCPADCNTCLPADQHICTMRKNQAGSGSSQTLGSVSQVGGYSLIVMLVNPLQIFNNLPSYLLIQFILSFIQNIPQQRTVQQIILKQFFLGGLCCLIGFQSTSHSLYAKKSFMIISLCNFSMALLI